MHPQSIIVPVSNSLTDIIMNPLYFLLHIHAQSLLIQLCNSTLNTIHKIPHSSMGILTDFPVRRFKGEILKCSPVSGRRGPIPNTADPVSIVAAPEPESLWIIIGKSICSCLNCCFHIIGSLYIAFSFSLKTAILNNCFKCNGIRKFKRKINTVQILAVIHHIILHQKIIQGLCISIQLSTIAVRVIVQRKKADAAVNGISCNSTGDDLTRFFCLNPVIFLCGNFSLKAI